MEIEITEYHKKRRAFIIIPNVGVLWAEPGSVLTHREILSATGISVAKIEKIIQTFPRGYFLDNTLVLYQGDVLKAGGTWELQPNNFPVVKKVFADLERMLVLNIETKIFLGVKCGVLGTVWEQYNQVDINFFK